MNRFESSYKTIKWHYKRLGRFDTIMFAVNAYDLSIEEAVKIVNSFRK